MSGRDAARLYESTVNTLVTRRTRLPVQVSELQKRCPQLHSRNDRSYIVYITGTSESKISSISIIRNHDYPNIPKL